MLIRSISSRSTLLAVAALVVLVSACAGGGAAVDVGSGGVSSVLDAGEPDITASLDLVSPDLVSADLVSADLVSPDLVSPDLVSGDLSVGADTSLTGPAAPRPYSGGICPVLAAGTNYMESDGRQRSFELYLPEEPTGAPVVFVWHGTGDTAKHIAEFFQALSAPTQHGVIVVSANDCCVEGHQDCCDQVQVWGFTPTAPARGQADVTLFDDILHCLDAQYDIDNERVYTTGFSAGSLWSTYLVVHRSEYLAAAAIFSGGIGDWVRYDTPVHKLPLLLAWGGETDTYMGTLVRFYEMMQTLLADVLADGHFVIACDHGLGHTLPWGAATWTYDFLLAHRWTADGASAFARGELGAPFPDYCEIAQPER